MKVSDDVVRAIVQLNEKLFETMDKAIEIPGKMFQTKIVIKVPVENKPNTYYAFMLSCDEYTKLELKEPDGKEGLE